MFRQRAEKGGLIDELLAARGAGSPVKFIVGDARGRPIAFHLTPGEAADCKSYDMLIDLPEQKPDALLADRAYDTDAIRADLKERGSDPSFRRNQTARQRSATANVSTVSTTATAAVTR